LLIAVTVTRLVKLLGWLSIPTTATTTMTMIVVGGWRMDKKFKNIK
jgi:hypothetical protein